VICREHRVIESAQIAARLRAAGGIARGRSLGATRSDLSRAVAVGAIERVRNGVYALGASPDVCAAAAHGGEVACVSALRAYGVWVLEDSSRLHVWIGPNARAHAHDDCRCVPHRDAGRSAFGIMSVVHALVQVAACCGSECFFVAFESAWRLGLLSATDRAEIRRLVSARYRWLVDLARPDADSGLESLLRLRLHRLGVLLECQVRIAGVGIVDFLLDGCLVIEVDGRDNHDGPSLRHKDLVRDAEAAAQGYETLRFDYPLIVHDWPRVERAILARLAVVRRRATDARYTAR
jgi:very-short-patch-repair endonuclease